MIKKTIDKLEEFLTMARYGYDKVSWMFVVVGSAALLTQAFGVTGLTSVIIAFIAFYVIGILHKEHMKRKK
jgi:hypothetical protein